MLDASGRILKSEWSKSKSHENDEIPLRTSITLMKRHVDLDLHQQSESDTSDLSLFNFVTVSIQSGIASGRFESAPRGNPMNIPSWRAWITYVHMSDCSCVWFSFFGACCRLLGGNYRNIPCRDLRGGNLKIIQRLSRSSGNRAFDVSDIEHWRPILIIESLVNVSQLYLWTFQESIQMWCFPDGSSRTEGAPEVDRRPAGHPLQDDGQKLAQVQKGPREHEAEALLDQELHGRNGQQEMQQTGKSRRASCTFTQATIPLCQTMKWTTRQCRLQIKMDIFISFWNNAYLLISWRLSIISWGTC